ncbi:hypothetical protein HanRHA438_Chr01g0040461 [Helianthus annuus]|nr:hypothetical protein HanRHA438_Chr01g0040461 [Helianthus annuus]
MPPLPQPPPPQPPPPPSSPLPQPPPTAIIHHHHLHHRNQPPPPPPPTVPSSPCKPLKSPRDFISEIHVQSVWLPLKNYMAFIQDMNTSRME